MQQHLEESMTQNEEMADEQINTTATFNIEDIRLATQQSNFNKGLGPDCFDGNVLTKNEQLGAKVMQEIADSLNTAQIPEYLRIGRLVPLQKTFTKGPCNLDEIRPIVVRSHLSKIMEKAILERIKSTCPHIISSKVY